MDKFTLTKQQARQFILIKQGLIGDYRFTGKEGVLAFVTQAGCIQYDPIDVCGKNAELVLQSRIKGFTKKMLYELLYEDRRLIDYFDKNLAILRVEDWPYLERIRESYRQWSKGRDEVDRIADEVKAAIKEKGPICSKDIGYQDKVDWYWSSTNLARAALETLYFRGELVIHHKKGTIKYYALAENYISTELLQTEDPNVTELEHLKWRVLRRISAVGMLWSKPSDAWLNIYAMKAEERNQVFTELFAEGKLLELTVEGCKDKLYCSAEDRWILGEIKGQLKLKERTELLAPLDCMLWDRKLIKELFSFEYKWEIYTPVEQRKYGYYVLPILRGEHFIGRCEVISNNRDDVLEVKNLWLEKNIKLTKKLQEDLRRCFLRFMKFHGLGHVEYMNDVPLQFALPD